MKLEVGRKKDGIHKIRSSPAGTQRRNDVVLTSMRRHVDVMCLLGRSEVGRKKSLSYLPKCTGVDCLTWCGMRK